MSGATIDLPTRRATIRLAARLAPELRPGDLVVLTGMLGAGKTFFVRAVCRALGLPARVPVTSPTFTLVQEIDTRPPVTHADLYRIGPDSAVRDLGLDAARGEGRVVLVEWGEPYLRELGGDALVLTFEIEPRRVTLRATGARSREVMERLWP